MPARAQLRPDLLLLLSILLIIVIFPVLDHDDVRRSILAALMFVPLTLATVRLSEIKDWAVPAVSLMAGAFLTAGVNIFFPNRYLVCLKWGILTVFFNVLIRL